MQYYLEVDIKNIGVLICRNELLAVVFAGEHLRGETMLEFAKLQKNAKELIKNISPHFMIKQGCMSFFSAIAPNSSAIDDASTISLLASSLDESNDKCLLSYVEEISKYYVVSSKEFEDFKTKALVGIYLIKWSNYNSSVAYYLNKPLVDFFQRDLEIQSPVKMDKRMVDSSLDALSQYCSYVYENRSKPIYADLNRQLGTTIQVNIHNIKNAKFTDDSSWYGVCAEIVRTLGMDNKS